MELTEDTSRFICNRKVQQVAKIFSKSDLNDVLDENPTKRPFTFSIESGHEKDTGIPCFISRSLTGQVARIDLTSLPAPVPGFKGRPS